LCYTSLEYNITIQKESIDNMYLKPGPNYKMSRQNKCFLASITDKEMRGHVKRMTIQADLHSLIVPKKERKPRGNTPDVQNDSENS